MVDPNIEDLKAINYKNISLKINKYYSKMDSEVSNSNNNGNVYAEQNNTARFLNRITTVSGCKNSFILSFLIVVPLIIIIVLSLLSVNLNTWINRCLVFILSAASLFGYYIKEKNMSNIRYDNN